MPKLRYLSLNVLFLKMNTMYTLDKETKMYTKIIFYIWRTLSILSLFTLLVQGVIDIFTRDEITFVEISSNVMNTGT